MSLLPSNETKSWQLYDEWVKGRLDRIEIIHNPLNPLNAPVHLLPYIAKEYDADVSIYTEAKQREILDRGIYIKAKIGTVAGVKEVLRSFDPNAKIVRYRDTYCYDGAYKHDGTITRHAFGLTHWAQWRVYLSRAMSITQATKLQKLLIAAAPARCQLVGWEYQETIAHEGMVQRNGTYTYGGYING
jgi:phage tail P2-like protein